MFGGRAAFQSPSNGLSKNNLHEAKGAAPRSKARLIRNKTTVIYRKFLTTDGTGPQPQPKKPFGRDE